MNEENNWKPAISEAAFQQKLIEKLDQQNALIFIGFLVVILQLSGVFK